MTNFPLVSIIIPVYNSEKYLYSTLDSCLMQEHKNIEIIVVDDGSSDESLKIAQHYAAKYSNIHAFSKENAGAPSARNFGFSKSKGIYIQFLDADDCLSSNKISSQLRSLNFSDCYEIASCSLYRFKDELCNAIKVKLATDRTFKSGIDWLKCSWSESSMGQTSTWLVHRQVIEEVGLWDERLLKNQDGEFFCRCMTVANKIIFTEESSVYYRLTGEGSISQSRTHKALESILLTYELYKKNITSNLDSDLNKGLAQCYVDFIDAYYPSLYFEAKSALTELEVPISSLKKKKPIAFLSYFVGFYNAIKLRHFLKSFLNKWK